MKLKFLFVLVLVIAFSSIAFAQSVVITPKKVTYKRPKPSADYKKSFIITRPVVKASTPALSKKIEAAISYEKNNDFKMSEEMGEFQWLEEANYIVNYNKNGLLDITLSMEGSAAYPSTSNKEVIIDLKTGNPVTAADVFTNLAGLTAKVRAMQLAEIKKAKIDYKKDPESADFDGSEYFNAAKYTVKDLNKFSVSDEGVTFNYDYEFAHVVQALQPDGIYLFSWADLNPYIKRGGLLAKFIR